MRYLLDTHAFLWWINRHENLSAAARNAIENAAEINVSAVNTWEVVIKARLGKFNMPNDIAPFLRDEIAKNGFRVLPVGLDHTLAVYSLADHPTHKDPFDRLLAAQSLSENLPLISKDEVFEGYGVERVW